MNAEMNITLEAPPPATGTDDALDNPVARAIRSLLEEGHRLTAVSQVVMVDHGGVQRWFGMFVRSAGGRILFFPGFAEQFDRIAGGGGAGAGKFDKPLVLDHLTLEADLATWHFTQASANGKRTHQGGPKTRPVGQGCVTWFGMATHGLDDFRPMRSKTVARAKSPPNDQEVSNRLGAFNAAIGSSRSGLLEIPAHPDHHLLYFQATVGPPGAPDYETLNIPSPGGVPFVKLGRLPDRMSAKHTSVVLSKETKIQVLAAWLPGASGRGITFI